MAAKVKGQIMSVFSAAQTYTPLPPLFVKLLQFQVRNQPGSIQQLIHGPPKTKLDRIGSTLNP